jgi:alpha-aminoadipate carrier protein LysW
VLDAAYERLTWKSPGRALFNLSDFAQGEKRMMQVECPECGNPITVSDDVIEGEILPCPECGVELEIIGLEPLTVDFAPTEMEDWGE